CGVQGSSAVRCATVQRHGNVIIGTARSEWRENCVTLSTHALTRIDEYFVTARVFWPFTTLFVRIRTVLPRRSSGSPHEQIRQPMGGKTAGQRAWQGEFALWTQWLSFRACRLSRKNERAGPERNPHQFSIR